MQKRDDTICNRGGREGMADWILSMPFPTYLKEKFKYPKAKKLEGKCKHVSGVRKRG